MVDAFAHTIKGHGTKDGRAHAAALKAAFGLKTTSDYSGEDLTDEGRRVRDRLGQFLKFCRELVYSAAPGG